MIRFITGISSWRKHAESHVIWTKCDYATDAQIDTLLIDNPRRYFAGEPLPDINGETA